MQARFGPTTPKHRVRDCARRSIRPMCARVLARVSKGDGQRPPLRWGPAGAVKQGVPSGDPPAAGTTGRSIAATSGTHSGTIDATFGRFARRLFLEGELRTGWEIRFPGLPPSVRSDVGLDHLPGMDDPVEFDCADGPELRRSLLESSLPVPLSPVIMTRKWCAATKPISFACSTMRPGSWRAAA